MPWSCKACQALVARDDVSTCPRCGGAKTAWSVAAEHTRKFVLATRPKLVALRGETFRTARGAPYRHRFTSWRETERASVLTSKRAARLMATDEVPDAHDLLCVRMTPPKTLARWVLTLSIKFEQEKVRDLALEFEPDREALDEDGAFSAYFVCVHGPEVAALRFPYIHVLDVTEATPLGHAPLLEVSGFRGGPVPVELGRPAGNVVAGARLPSLFTFAKTFPKPSCRPVLAELVRRLTEDPELIALVVGHADPVGNDELNHALSRERAATVAALMAHDLPDLRRRFEAPDPAAQWDMEDVQWLLAGAKVGGEVAYPGYVDGHTGPLTRQALGWFQVAEGLPYTGVCDEPTLERLLVRYVEVLGPAVDRSRIVIKSCGSWHPPRAFGNEPEAERGLAERDPRHRRVEVFLCRGAPQPPPGACGAAVHSACPAYDRWVDGARADVVTPAGGPPPVTVAVSDRDGQPLPDTELSVHELGEVQVEVYQGRTDDLGRVRIALRAGLHQVRVRRGDALHLAPLRVEMDEVGVAHHVSLADVTG